MRCLNDAEMQAFVDGEASEAVRRHAVSCPQCADRAHDRRQLMASAIDAIGPDVAIPDYVAHKIQATLAGSQAGATRLRSEPRKPHRRAFWSAAVAAAATLAAVLFVAPLIKGPTTVSAAEILAASASRLQSPPAGIELREYELVLEGVPQQLMPDHANGVYRVWQAIDHDTPGRFRFASFGPDGQPISSIAQDPHQHRRVTMMVLDGQRYRFDTSLPSELPMSLPELERLHMEATITMMRASANQLLQIVDTPAGQQYRIEVQHAAAGDATSPVWDLTGARVVVDAQDYRIMEFAASGTFLKQPYSVSYKLIRQTVLSQAAPDMFEVPRQPGEIELSGEGTAVPMRDAMVLAFRELTRLKQSR